ncbi:MAG: hypothetical protein ACI8XB_002110, partial [Patiriisocius sp.]
NNYQYSLKNKEPGMYLMTLYSDEFKLSDRFVLIK